MTRHYYRVGNEYWTDIDPQASELWVIRSARPIYLRDELLDPLPDCCDWVTEEEWAIATAEDLRQELTLEEAQRVPPLMNDDELTAAIHDCRSFTQLTDLLEQEGFRNLGCMNGWTDSSGEYVEQRTLPWNHSFSKHDWDRCVEVSGDFERREFYKVDSGD